MGTGEWDCLGDVVVNWRVILERIVKVMECEAFDLIQLLQEAVELQVFLNTVRSLPVPYKVVTNLVCRPTDEVPVF
jgi:hypothetical protein